MFTIIRYDNAAHRVNEHTEVLGPFATADAATVHAENNVKFYTINRLRTGQIGALRIPPPGVIAVGGPR